MNDLRSVRERKVKKTMDRLGVSDSRAYTGSDAMATGEDDVSQPLLDTACGPDQPVGPATDAGAGKGRGRPGNYEPWFIVGCLRCQWTAHTPDPPETCPNDGSELARLPGLVSMWDGIEILRELARIGGERQGMKLAQQHVLDARGRVESIMRGVANRGY